MPTVLHISPPALVYIIHLIRTFGRWHEVRLPPWCRLRRTRRLRSSLVRVSGSIRSTEASNACQQNDTRPDLANPCGFANPASFSFDPSLTASTAFGLPDRNDERAEEPRAQLWAGAATSSPSRTRASAARLGVSSLAASASQIRRASGYRLAAMYA